MKTKIFALASFTTLTGLACTASIASSTDDSASTSAPLTLRKADAATLTIAGITVPTKVDRVKKDKIDVEVGIDPDQTAFWQWLRHSFDTKYSRQKGSVVGADYDDDTHAERAFTDAVVSEIGFPALDGSSKDPAFVSLEITADFQHTKHGGGALIDASDHVQKPWSPAAFQLAIDGLDTKDAASVGALVVKTHADEPKPHLETPNVVFTVSETHADAIYRWHKDFVISGGSQDKEKSGSITYLTPDRERELLTVDLEGLGIFAIEHPKSTPGFVKVKMHVRNLALGCRSCAVDNDR